MQQTTHFKEFSHLRYEGEDDLQRPERGHRGGWHPQVERGDHGRVAGHARAGQADVDEPMLPRDQHYLAGIKPGRQQTPLEPSAAVFVSLFQRSRGDRNIDDRLRGSRVLRLVSNWLDSRHLTLSACIAAGACLSVSHSWCSYPFYTFEPRMQTLLNSRHRNITESRAKVAPSNQ